MGRIRRGGYMIESWIGDHEPKHVHIYRDGRLIAKVEVPSLLILSGHMNRRLRRILEELLEEGRI
ncbi:MAG: hypothetical protein C5B49_01440 [Bdellovibrio sp.]|nr:MAG: hypothetical protein C5B49_01440 [Bdellovibrio sp.]